MDKPLSILRNSDPLLYLPMLCLLVFGVFMVYSTTAISAEQAFGNSTHFAFKHLSSLFIGLIAFFCMLSFKPEMINKYALSLLILAFILLFLVAIPGIGQVSGGARRWLGVGFFRAQPGEFVKVFVMIFFAHYIAKYKNIMWHAVPGIVTPILILSFLGAFYLLQPDLGSFVVVAIVTGTLLLTTANFKHLIYLALLGIGIFAVAVLSSRYRMDRVLSFLDPVKTALDGGYQLNQSLIAIGSGGFWGAGIGAGKQKLYFLPAAHTDFIYAMIGEEVGFIGSFVVLALFVLIALRGLKVAKRHLNNTFYFGLAIGCTMLIVMPAFLNIGVALGLLPTKGMVLPFMSYGGSALIAYLIVMGILLKLSAVRNEVNI